MSTPVTISVTQFLDLDARVHLGEKFFLADLEAQLNHAPCRAITEQRLQRRWRSCRSARAFSVSTCRAQGASSITFS